MQDRVGFGGVPENRVALLAVLLAQPELDRTALEIREKASAVFQVLWLIRKVLQHSIERKCLA